MPQSNRFIKYSFRHEIADLSGVELPYNPILHHSRLRSVLRNKKHLLYRYTPLGASQVGGPSFS
jgi:hypothetical protein